MTDKVNPSPGRAAVGYETATAIRHGAQTDGWIVPIDETILADADPDITGTPLNAFRVETMSGSTLTVGSGEAFVGGAWLARDTQTDVVLPTTDGTYTVYVGWAASASNTVIIGTSDAFGTKDPKIPIHETTVSGGAIQYNNSVRQIGPAIDVPNQRYELLGQTAEIPITTLGNNDVARVPEVIPEGRTLKVIRASAVNGDGQAQSGVRARIYDADMNSLRNWNGIHLLEGSRDNPLDTFEATNGDRTLFFGCHNTTDGEVDAGARFTYFIE